MPQRSMYIVCRRSEMEEPLTADQIKTGVSRRVMQTKDYTNDQQDT